MACPLRQVMEQVWFSLMQHEHSRTPAQSCTCAHTQTSLPMHNCMRTAPALLLTTCSGSRRSNGCESNIQDAGSRRLLHREGAIRAAEVRGLSVGARPSREAAWDPRADANEAGDIAMHEQPTAAWIACDCGVGSVPEFRVLKEHAPHMSR